jgi:hypothetical protein
MKYLFLPIVVLFILATSLTYSQVNYQTGNFAAAAGTSGYTLDKGTGDLKYDVQTSLITNEGFTVKIKTWGEGKLKAIGGTWLAITK